MDSLGILSLNEFVEDEDIGLGVVRVPFAPWLLENPQFRPFQLLVERDSTHVEPKPPLLLVSNVRQVMT